MNPRKKMAMMKSGGAVKKMRGGGMVKKMRGGGMVKKLRGGGMVKKLNKGGSASKPKKGKFPDLTGDGKVTKKDVLVGRGVLKRNEGGPVDINKELVEILKGVPPTKIPDVIKELKRSKKNFLADVPPAKMPSPPKRSKKKFLGDFPSSQLRDDMRYKKNR